MDVLIHHGIKGQKWGVRNALWYPIADWKRHATQKHYVKKIEKQMAKEAEENKKARQKSFANELLEVNKTKYSDVWFENDKKRRAALANVKRVKDMFNDPEYKRAREARYVTDEFCAWQMFEKLPKKTIEKYKLRAWNGKADMYGMDKVEKADLKDKTLYDWLMYEDWDQGAPGVPSSMDLWLQDNGVDGKKMTSDWIKHNNDMRQREHELVDDFIGVYANAQYALAVNDSAKLLTGKRAVTVRAGDVLKSTLNGMLLDYDTTDAYMKSIGVNSPDDYIKLLKSKGY